MPALAAILPLGLLVLRRRKLASLLAATITFVTLGMLGCGGKSNADTRIRYAAPGTYTFTVTASSTTGVPITQTVTATVVVQQK